ILREIEHQRLPIAESDPARGIPISGTECLQLRRPVLTDPDENFTAYVSEATSHPSWLIARWVSHFGREAAEAICLYGMTRPVVHLRPNRLRIDAEALAGRLHKEGFTAEVSSAETVTVLGNTA